MKDYSLNVLEQYEIEVSGTRKVRGAILCDTNAGVLLLREAAVSDKKVPVLEALTTHLTHHGYPRVDSIFPVSYTHLDVYKRQGNNRKYKLYGNCEELRKQSRSYGGDQ